MNLTENEISKIVVDVVINLHKDLGPGLLESVYETILAHELRSHGLSIEQQKPIPIVYKNHTFDQGFKADIVINKKVTLELKSVKEMNDVFKKQLLTYLKLSNIKLGLLLNFGSTLMKDGISRTVNGTLV